MNFKITAVAFSFFVLLTGSGGAYALLGSDACRNTRFTVNNEYNRAIEVRRFELHSVDEGRWLNENFRDIMVPAGARGFVVRDGESVEYAEGDDIDQIRVHFRIMENNRWENRESVDREIANQKCVADKTYNATVARER